MRQFLITCFSSIIAMLFAISRDKFKDDKARYNYKYRNYLIELYCRFYNTVLQSKAAIVFYALMIVFAVIGCFALCLICYLRWIELGHTRTLIVFTAIGLCLLAITFTLKGYFQFIQEATIYQYRKKLTKQFKQIL